YGNSPPPDITPTPTPNSLYLPFISEKFDGKSTIQPLKAAASTGLWSLLHTAWQFLFNHSATAVHYILVSSQP
ncbi:MAG: hypothetical protein P8183_10225, partial [Anaerolineae bacterium]